LRGEERALAVARIDDEVEVRPKADEVDIVKGVVDAGDVQAKDSNEKGAGKKARCMVAVAIEGPQQSARVNSLVERTSFYARDCPFRAPEWPMEGSSQGQGRWEHRGAVVSAVQIDKARTGDGARDFNELRDVW
jgi:hypothetical protein